MPCKNPASCNALECVAKPGKPDHVWPEEGHLIVERCERFCWYCYRSKGKVNEWKYAWYLRRHVENVHVGRTHPNLTCSQGWKKSQTGNKKPWRNTGSPPPMGRTSSPAPGSTPPPNTPRTPQTPSRQQKRATFKKKYNEKMATPSPSNSAGSSTSTPSSGLTINTAITTPPLLQGPLPKGFSLTPRTQAWYDQIHGNSSSFGNNNANQAPMHMATSMPNGMAAAQNNGLGLTYGNGIAAPQANNTVKNFNGNANNTVAEGPGKDFYTFLAKMKANPADHITMVNQQEIINSASTINYNAGMAASQEDMAITGFDDRMDTSMGAMSYINNNGSHFVNHNEFSTMSYDNGINTNSAGTVINPALVSQENSVQDCSSINTFAPGIGSNMFETSEAVLDRPLSPLDFSAWDDFINMEPTGGILTLPPAGNYESSGTATVDNDMTSAGTVGAPTSSATVSPTAIANLSLAPINTTSPATSTTASPEANITPSAAAAANTTHATTATEDAGQTQDTTARKQIFGLFQISRTDGTTISLEFTTDPGATGMIESLNNLVQDARCGGLRDGGILFVLQEYVRMYKNGECF